MAVREVSIYTCDGCTATAALDRHTTARGWHTIKVDGRKTGALLCTVCYAAVEWVMKFQGVTHPPKVYRSRYGGYHLRKDDTPPGPEPEEEEDDDVFEEGDES